MQVKLSDCGRRVARRGPARCGSQDYVWRTKGETMLWSTSHGSPSRYALAWDQIQVRHVCWRPRKITQQFVALGHQRCAAGVSYCIRAMSNGQRPRPWRARYPGTGSSLEGTWARR